MNSTRIIENQEGDKEVTGLIPRARKAIRRKSNEIFIAGMFLLVVALGFFAVAAWGGFGW